MHPVRRVASRNNGRTNRKRDIEIGGRKLVWIHRLKQGEFYVAVENLSRRRDGGNGRRSGLLVTLQVLIKKSWSCHG